MNAIPDGVQPDPTMMSVERNRSSADFFDAAARGELLLKRCVNCAHVRAARRPTCRACGHSASTGLAASGRGTLVTWAAHPARGESSPRRVFGMVELAEGPWMESALVDVAEDRLRGGLGMRVTFVSGAEGEAYPAFTAAD